MRRCGEREGKNKQTETLIRKFDVPGKIWILQKISKHITAAVTCIMMSSVSGC